jgi:hypothetical protein
MPPLNPASARYFRDEFRAARTRALRDAEDFGAVVVVLERLAHYLSPKVASLGTAAGPLATVAKASCLSLGSPDGEYGLTFEAHLHTLRRGRNMAEPPRLLRRPQRLRGWGHGKTRQVPGRGEGAGGAARI